MQEPIAPALARLYAYIEREGFRGYDPYDALNGWIDFRRFGKWAPILATQVQKRNPVNLRPLLGIEKAYNPKAMGLLLEAYSLLYARDADEAVRDTAAWLFEWLRAHIAEGYSGACWGYNFGWASPVKYLPPFTPSVVVTGFVARGIHTYYEATRDDRAPDVLRRACDFVLRDLPVRETDDGLCFSYTPTMPDCCYNASLLGAELLARAYALSGEADLRDRAARAVRFVLARQHEDGRWNYSLDPETGAERAQVDFHQGFVLDSLRAFRRYGRPDAEDDAACETAIRRGAHFYRTRQFAPDGRSYWRLPARWPTDIHHQAQGILTFAGLADLDPAHLPFAHTVARWTIEHLQDPDGYFYYRKGRLLTNRIPYVRWGQAWMMVALARLLTAETAGKPTPRVAAERVVD